MTARKGIAAIGDVMLAAFPQHIPPGHEQEGQRPAVIVGLPEALGVPRFPLMLVVPLTTDRGQPWALRSPALYPRIPAGAGGLPRDSLALLDQLCILTAWRVGGLIGTLPPANYQPIREGLRRLLGE